jgi:hypothetical protein
MGCHVAPPGNISGDFAAALNDSGLPRRYAPHNDGISPCLAVSGNPNAAWIAASRRPSNDGAVKPV